LTVPEIRHPSTLRGQFEMKARKASLNALGGSLFDLGGIVVGLGIQFCSKYVSAKAVRTFGRPATYDPASAYE
jgi:hypothetical protein